MRNIVSTFLVVLSAVLVQSCSHCSFNPSSRDSACLPCNTEFVQRPVPLPNERMHKLTIKVVDRFGFPVSSDGVCPEFHVAGRRLGADHFKEERKGFFSGVFPEYHEAWAALMIKTEYPRPFGRGYQWVRHFDCDSTIEFVLDNWTLQGRRWLRDPGDDQVPCSFDSTSRGEPAGPRIDIPPTGAPCSKLLPRKARFRVINQAGFPMYKPGMCLEIFMDGVIHPIAVWKFDTDGATSRTFYSPEKIDHGGHFHWTAVVKWEGETNGYHREIWGGVPQVRIPAFVGHLIRFIPDSDSDSVRTGNPVHIGHPIRSLSDRHSD